MAHVTLIRPPSMTAKWVPAVIATPPLAQAYLAGFLTHHGHEVDVIDCMGEALDHKHDIPGSIFSWYGMPLENLVQRISDRTDIIGISCMFTQEWPGIRKIIQAIREKFPQKTIVCGGEHITAESEFTLRDCPSLNYAVSGEGEETLLELVECISQKKSTHQIQGLAFLENNEFKKNPARPRMKSLDEVPLPRWDLTPIHNYLDRHLGFGVKRGRSIPLMATRGCPYRCTFCSSPQMWTTAWIARSPENVIAEMEKYIQVYQVDNFDFYDLTAIVKKEWIVRFCNLLMEKKWDITWQLPSGTRSEALDAETCSLLQRSGCRNITYAPESGSPAVLQRIKKRVDLSRMMDSMKSAMRSGINVKYNLIFGFPDETHRQVLQSLFFVAKTAWIGVHDASIWLFSPYPGSELFSEIKSQGKIQFDDRYFVSLSAYSDFSNSVSWNPRMSARWLKFYRLFGTALFYGLSYLFHPQRVLQTSLHLWTGKHESKLETVIAAWWGRSRRGST